LSRFQVDEPVFPALIAQRRGNDFEFARPPDVSPNHKKTPQSLAISSICVVMLNGQTADASVAQGVQNQFVKEEIS
jgi:hypothetical protein